jgi:two-component system sensor histidine kinase KdpD
LFRENISHQITALILLANVAMLGILLDFKAVLISSVLSALILNYFFIEPYYTFHIHSTEDILMFSIYFVIVVIYATLSNRILRQQEILKEKQEGEKLLNIYQTVLNSLSHEFRTPLAAIITATDTLKENSPYLTEKMKLEILNEVEIASNRLKEQTDNLLNMGRLDSGMYKVKTEWCDINDLINNILHRFELGNRNLEIKAEGALPFYKIDIAIWEQILSNICSNVEKYTPQDANILFKIIPADGVLELQYSDDGPGIPNEYHIKVFEKFFRVNSAGKSGTGLGMSIIKGFVELQNGKIEIEENQPSGLLLKISVPAETTYINQLNYE